MVNSSPVYLDFNATTPVLPEVLDEMFPYLTSNFWNPSSTHPGAILARKAIANSRRLIAQLINCLPEEIIFTSGGTEANNMAIRGIAENPLVAKNHLITSSVEHPSVINVCKYLESLGYIISYIPVDSYGMVNPLEIKKAIRPTTCMISIMHANNEVGTIQPIEEISTIARSQNIPFHTDACQSIGKIKCDVTSLDVDLMTIAGHKIYAPKGIGALYIKKGTKVSNILFGGGQEHGKRPGTENVAFIIGLGKACEIALTEFTNAQLHLRKMTNRLLKNLESNLHNRFEVNGHPQKKLPNTLSLSITGISGNTLMDKLGEEVIFSTGSACHTGNTTISSVLKAMNISYEKASGTVRFSTGKSTTEVEIDLASHLICEAVNHLRNS